MGKELSKGFLLRVILLALLNGAVLVCCEALLPGRQDSAVRPPSMLPPWRPNRPPSGIRYVGDDACAQCHKAKTTSQKTTGMARALEPGSDSGVLRSRPHLSFRSGAYVYEIVREADKSVYSVSDGSNKISEPILYAFGQGNAGQTYVIFHDGSYYESRVSFYREISGLDLTLGSRDMAPASLNEALGRKMSQSDGLIVPGLLRFLSPQRGRSNCDAAARRNQQCSFLALPDFQEQVLPGRPPDRLYRLPRPSRGVELESGFLRFKVPRLSSFESQTWTEAGKQREDSSRNG